MSKKPAVRKPKPKSRDANQAGHAVFEAVIARTEKASGHPRKDRRKSASGSGSA